MKKHEELNKPKSGDLEPPEEDLQFILWKAELNKELLEFWKSMLE